MDILISILVFLVVLFVLVLVHEWGHFITAKKTGMRVDEFGIGFPPKLFSIKKGETEYSFNLLPIGGFVKIWGEDGVSTPSSPVANEASDRRSEPTGEAGEGGANPVTSSLPDYSRSFVAKSKWAQAVVLLAGVTMNVLLAWFLFMVALSVGVPSSVDEAQASENAQLMVLDVVADSPADMAGLEPGAVITEVRSGEDEMDALTPASFVSFVQTHRDSEIEISYVSKGEDRSISVTPAPGVAEGMDSEPKIGVASALIDTVRRPVHIAVIEGTVLTVTMLKNVVVALSTLLWDAVQFNADLSEVAGPVGIVGVVGEYTESGFTSLLMFTAFISLNLAVINLLPFPALDGGRLLFVAIEAVKGSPIRPQFAQALNTIGFMLLILLMIAVTYNDILRII